MRTAALILTALLLAGCAEASPKQEVTVAASPRAGLDVTAAQAAAWLEAHPDVVPPGDRDVYQAAVVLATSRDKDSWQARLWTRAGVRSVVSDYCTDPSAADLEIVAGDVVRWYDRHDGEVTVGDQRDGFCRHLAIMRVLVPAALAPAGG